MYRYGGVYVDVDYECIQPLDVLSTYNCSFFAGLSNNTSTLEINNGIIGYNILFYNLLFAITFTVRRCTPGHMLIEQILSEIADLTPPFFMNDDVNRLSTSFFDETATKSFIASQSILSVLLYIAL